ncbi:MAG: hypothetical protein JXD23_01735 [Spirochaetales bacterium]|nr:hypothetical protein [Spirochaetales bacterium]
MIDIIVIIAEIVVIIFVSKIVGDAAKDKIHSRGLFRGLAIGAWFTGELIGVISAFLLFRNNTLAKYLFAAGGAIVGLGVIALILLFLPEKGGPGGKGVAENWLCPACGFKNSMWRSRCFKCGFERPIEQPVPAAAEGRGRTWQCTGCGSVNLESDETCYHCKSKKPSGAEPDGV